MLQTCHWSNWEGQESFAHLSPNEITHYPNINLCCQKYRTMCIMNAMWIVPKMILFNIKAIIQCKCCVRLCPVICIL